MVCKYFRTEEEAVEVVRAARKQLIEEGNGIMYSLPCENGS